MSFRRVSVPLALAAVSALALAGCASENPSPADGGTIRIVASTNVYGDIAQTIAGDAAEVWWVERRGHRVATWHRALRPQGGVDPERAPVEEPALDGALPFAARRGGEVVFVARRGARSAVATARCAP